jgi:hypothetical protein
MWTIEDIVRNLKTQTLSKVRGPIDVQTRHSRKGVSPLIKRISYLAIIRIGVVPEVQHLSQIDDLE